MIKGMKGPRPLSLHVSNSAITWDAVAENGSQFLASLQWHDNLEKDVTVLRQRLTALAVNTDRLDDVIASRAANRKNKFLSGVNSYLSHSHQPEEIKADSCFEVGRVKLHDYGGTGQPILMITSLINPNYIVDLMPGRSLVGFLKNAGYRPLLVNWGEPGPEERNFGLDQYIMKRLLPILNYAADIAGGPIPVIGYCMAGTLAVALAVQAPTQVSKLALLAAPWDFKADVPHPGRRYAAHALKHLSKLPEGATLSVDMLQSFFTSVDPTLSDRKFRRYAAGDYTGEKADFFSAMEVWANNSAPLASKVAQDCLQGWYQQNVTARHKWVIGGSVVRPADIVCPVWVASPKNDRLVPQESAFAVLKELRQAEKHEPPSGHIGMVVGDRAQEGLWEPLVKWLRV